MPRVRGPHVGSVADDAPAAQAAAEGRWDEVDARLRQALPLRRADAIVGGWPRSSRPGNRLLAARPASARHPQPRGCRARDEEVGDEALRGAALRALAAVALQDRGWWWRWPTLRRRRWRRAHPETAVPSPRCSGRSATRPAARDPNSLSGEAFRTAAGILAGGDEAPPARPQPSQTVRDGSPLANRVRGRCPCQQVGASDSGGGVEVGAARLHDHPAAPPRRGGSPSSRAPGGRRRRRWRCRGWRGGSHKRDQGFQSPEMVAMST